MSDYIRTFSDDDPINERIRSMNPNYRRQIDPYLSYNYKSGFLDKMGNLLGFNTAEDKYRMQMQDRARQALAAIENDIFQNEYNSMQQKVSRDRNAGINPDISGEVQSENAAQLEQPFQGVDPSIFTQPVDIPDITSMFDNAFTGLNSVMNFKNMLHIIRGSKATANKLEINSYEDAFAFAKDYLSQFDPSTRQVPDSDPISADEFANTIVPSKIQSLRKSFPGMSDETNEIVSRAMRALANSPEVYDRYFENASKASKSHIDKLASDAAYGKYDVADDFVRFQNKESLDFMIARNKLMAKYSAISLEYNNQRLQNDWDFERFKQEKGLPEMLAETELSQYLSNQAKSDMQVLLNNISEHYISKLNELAKSNDPAAQYLLQGIISGNYPALFNTSVSGGIFGVKGAASWNSFITPGMATPLQNVGKGISSGYQPNPDDPFNWINHK